jgi:hypothetical protein
MGWELRAGRILRIAALAAAALLAPAGAARADGCHFPERAFPRPPAIPAQRALLVHRDGFESLTVESALDAEGQSFGWILPVPARPRLVEEGTTGPLDVLDLQTGPEVVHDPYRHDSMLEVSILCFLAWAVAARILLVRVRFTPQGRVLTYLMCVLALLCGGMLVPNLLAARLGEAPVATPGVSASETRRIGNYAVTVLEARDPRALDGWLTGNGFTPLPAAGNDVAAAYIAEKWCFVAARLVRDGKGPAAPHPLRVEFPSKEPVYPMRLTALAGGRTGVRLWVAAGSRVGGEGLTACFCDRLRGPESGRTHALDEDHPVLRGETTGRMLGHPALLAALRSGDTLTRLEGSFTPADMARDIVLRPAEGEAFVPTVYSAEGAFKTALAWALPIWLLAVAALVYVPPGRLGLGDHPASSFLRGLLCATGGAALLLGVIRWSLPVVPVTVGDAPNRRLSYRLERAWREMPDAETAPGRTLDELRVSLRRVAQSRADVRHLPARVAEPGDSPGDSDLLEDSRGLVLRVWMADGWPRETVLRERAAPAGGK